MRAKEFINESLLNELDRRQFLQKGGRTALGLTVPSVAQAGAGEFLPRFEYQRLTPQQKQIWTHRAQNLQAAAMQVFQKLSNFVDEQDKKYLSGIKFQVTAEAPVYDWARVSLVDKIIEIDVGTFWDLGNDTLAYTVAHEMAHIVFYNRGQHPIQTINTPAKRWANVQRELECDTYGAQLAFRAGYDPGRAWAKMDQEAKSWKYDPKDNQSNYYPDYSMRLRNFNQAIQKIKQDLEAAKIANNREAIQKAKQDLENLVQQIHGQQPPEPTLIQDKHFNVNQALFTHIKRGISNLT